MDFLKILRSFEEFIFEAATWLIFYPLTMWRIVRSPLGTMAYSDREQAETETRRYDDSLSPPLLLLVTIVLGNLLASAFHIVVPHGPSALGTTVMSSPENLALFRSLIFSLVPLVSAASLLHRKGVKISRETLRSPFYAQCYLAAPSAAFLAAGGIFLQRPDLPSPVGASVIVAGTIWFLVIQTRWFRSQLQVSWANAAWTALWAMARAMACLLVIVVPVALLSSHAQALVAKP